MSRYSLEYFKNNKRILTLKQIGEYVGRVIKGKCNCCDIKLHKLNIRSYDHDGGIKIKGYKKPQWVYFECSYCGYNTSLVKIISKYEKGIIGGL